MTIPGPNDAYRLPPAVQPQPPWPDPMPEPFIGEVPVRPRSVTIAFWLWLVAAGAYLAEILAEIYGIPALPNLRPWIPVVVRVVNVILLAAWVVVIFEMRAGRDWARVLMTVLGVVEIVFAVSGPFMEFVLRIDLGVLATVFPLVGAIAMVAAIVFMYRKDAEAYFRRPLVS